MTRDQLIPHEGFVREVVRDEISKSTVSGSDLTSYGFSFPPSAEPISQGNGDVHTGDMSFNGLVSPRFHWLGDCVKLQGSFQFQFSVTTPDDSDQPIVIAWNVVLGQLFSMNDQFPLDSGFGLYISSSWWSGSIGGLSAAGVQLGGNTLTWSTGEQVLTPIQDQDSLFIYIDGVFSND